MRLDIDSLDVVDDNAELLGATRTDHYDPVLVAQYWFGRDTYKILLDEARKKEHFIPLIFAIIKSNAVGMIYAMACDGNSCVDSLFREKIFRRHNCLLYKDSRGRYFFGLGDPYSKKEQLTHASQQPNAVRDLSVASGA